MDSHRWTDADRVFPRRYYPLVKFYARPSNARMVIWITLSGLHFNAVSATILPNQAKVLVKVESSDAVVELAELVCQTARN